MNSFIHSFTKHSVHSIQFIHSIQQIFIENYNVPSAIYGTENIGMSTTNKNPDHHGATILVEEDIKASK